MSGLTDALRAIGPLSDASAEALAAIARPVQFAAGEWLLRAGERAQWCFLLERGLVRELYIDDAGAEHTRRFLHEGEVTGSLLDLLSNEPSVTWIQAIEDARALRWRYSEFDALTARHADLAHLARRTAEALYVRKARREHELLALPAAERYARWLAEDPSLDARVSRRHLASYLGVTPEHLSRLRRTGGGAKRTARR